MSGQGMTVEQTLKKAEELNEQGDVAQAIQFYQSILERYPGNQQAKAGLQSLQSQQATPQDTGLNQALGSLKILYSQGKFQELVQQAIPLTQHYSDSPLLWNILGSVHFQLGGLNQAADCYTKAIRLNPDDAKAYSNLGLTLNNLDRHQEAMTHCFQALRLNPKNAVAHNNLGNAFNNLGRHKEAIQSYNKALQYRPDYAEAHYNLGSVFYDLDRHEEAIQSYNKALQYQPDYVKAYNNLGNVFYKLNQHEKAIKCYNKALQRQSDYLDAHNNLALAFLHQGKLAQGWQEHEWRLKKKEYRELIDRIEGYEQRLWNSKDPLQGKTILLNAEQGLGDTIQFCRYAKLLEQQGATVILSVPAPLQRLMQVLSPTVQVVGGNIPRQFDTHCHLMSLPYLLQTELDTIPADIPYLFAEPERQARWQALLDSNDYKIGIAWQGNKNYIYDHLRSFPLFHFEGLSKLAGVRLISLQKNEGVEQIAGYRDRVDVAELGQEYDLGDFIDTAAIMACLDLVITSDSAIAHLAGALGIKTWVLLPYVADWRWLGNRTDSPWYPGMRLFRQAESGDWAGVFKQVEKTLISQVITEV